MIVKKLKINSSGIRLKRYSKPLINSDISCVCEYYKCVYWDSKRKRPRCRENLWEFCNFYDIIKPLTKFTYIYDSKKIYI